MHSCIRLYNAQHCSFIGQISVVLDSIVYDTWMEKIIFFEFNVVIFFKKNFYFKLFLLLQLFCRICKAPFEHLCIESATEKVILI